ncbi:sensor histidine kinase [Cytobacillus firmus]|uniref:sensor histidine kinase n=1 Tax=Cytobacillus firmus TaxID=1399 RepID=UPI002162A366|nr:sensor histidine kinase [Cytobacillus firmus]MCS0671382.1 sensor histidine kinase [Cytobacillus firmus]
MKSFLFSLKKFNTLRNQILAVFLSVMLFVLAFVSLVVYDQLGGFFRQNAERQIQQTAAEANGRMETLYKQIDTLTNQLMTNSTVQQMLLKMLEGESMDYGKLESLIKIINNTYAYSDGISSIELYNAEGKRIYPFDGKNIFKAIDSKWVKAADKEKGKLVWTGKDQGNSSYSAAIRRVSLMDRWFTNGGYLVVRISNSYFQVQGTNEENGQTDYMMLLDRDLTPITYDYGLDIKSIIQQEEKSIMIHDQEYMAITEKSALTGWTFVILKPMSFLLQGVSKVRAVIILAVSIGFFLFVISSIVLATMITRPIKKLTNTMKNAKMDELKLNPESNSSLEFIELNNTYNKMVERTNHLIQVVYEKELLRSRTELKALQAQIDPHFLYNTLNALYWSLEEKEEEELAEIVISMSELFRYTIGNRSSAEWVTIHDELDHIERYMRLMKMRLGERLLWKIAAPPKFLGVKIPKLIIQPLVENAIQHGIENKRIQGTVLIKLEESAGGDSIKITVQDNGPGIDQTELHQLNEEIKKENVSSFKGIGMALTNVNKRLRLYYDAYSLGGLHLESELGSGTKVVFEIPAGEGIKGEYKDNLTSG